MIAPEKTPDDDRYKYRLRFCGYCGHACKCARHGFMVHLDECEKEQAKRKAR